MNRKSKTKAELIEEIEQREREEEARNAPALMIVDQQALQAAVDLLVKLPYCEVGAVVNKLQATSKRYRPGKDQPV